MPKIVPVFLIPYKARQDLINKLKSCGLRSWEHFIDDSPYSGKIDCYLKTEGTLLRSELDQVDGRYVYKLFYNEMQIAETSMDAVHLYTKMTSQVSHLSDLPASLLKDEATIKKEKCLEEKQAEIILPIGKNMPNDYIKNHLIFLEINEKELYFDEDQKQYVIKLAKKNGFSYKKHVDVSDCPRMIYELEYKGHRFASIREDYYETLPGLWFGSTRLDVDVVQIAFARNNPENLILVPSLGAYKEDGIRKIMALGTVESCFQIIKNNLCTDFCLEYNAHREKFVEQFHYRIFDSKKAKLLISALKQNETIEKINLMGVHISKDDFHGLIETLASKKSFKELNLGNAYFHFTNAEFETIQKSIKNFKVISGGASFLEAISELNKKETESKPMKKFGGHIRACMLDKADNLVSVNWHHTGFYSIKEKLIPYKFPFEKIIENSKELYEIYRAFEEINYHKVNIKNKKQYDDAYDDFSEIIQDVAERVPKQESTIELLGKEIEVLNKIKAIFSVNGINFELEEESIGLRFS